MSKCLWLSFCLVSLIVIAPAAHAAPSSGGPILDVAVTSSNVHPGDYVSLSVSSVASWNGTRTNYSQGPVLIDAVASTGSNYSPLEGLHELVNGSFGIGWIVGDEAINYIGVQVRDLQTGLSQQLVINVNPSWSQVAGIVNRTLGDALDHQGANDRQQTSDMWLLFYVLSATLFGLGLVVILAIDNGYAHRQVPPAESKWDRVKGWVRISREPIPDAIDLAFMDREHVYSDLPLKMQLDIFDHREEYLNWTEAKLREVLREIKTLPQTRREIRERFVKNRRELNLDPDWEA